MNTKWVVIGVISSLSLATVTGCTSQDQPASANVQQGPVVTVKVEQVVEGEVNEPINLLAEVHANTSVAVLPKVAGTLVKLHVKKGDLVKKHQVIGELDGSDFQLGVRQAQAAYEQAQAALKQAQAGNGVDQEGSSSVELAKRGLEIAQSNYDRMKALFSSGAISQSQLEQAEAALNQARAGYNQASQGMASVEMAKAGVAQALVGLEKARKTLNDTQITATVDGIVTNVSVEVGESVNPQSPVANIINIDPVLVRLNVSEANLPKFKKGTEVEVRTQTFTTMGKVTYVALEADAASKMFPIEIEVPNPAGTNSDATSAGGLIPGMKVNVVTKDTSPKKGLLISTDAILEQDGKKFVYVIEGDTAMKREVTISEGNTEKVIVEQGLSAGDKVVVKGQTNLKDQSKVRIEE